MEGKKSLSEKIPTMLHGPHEFVHSCNFLIEDRLGGWGTKGPKAMTLGQCKSVSATIQLGSEIIYLVLGLTQSQSKVYHFAFHGLVCVTIQCVRYYLEVLYLQQNSTLY